MKKLIPLLILCFAVLCFFSSCGLFETFPVEGTWKYDFASPKFGHYGEYEYFTFKLVFSEDKVQIIRYQYDSPARNNLISTEATEIMPYTVGKDGSVTVTHSVDIVNQTNIVETFTGDKNQNRLTWKQGYNSGDSYTFDKESSATDFVEPSRVYEQYKLPSSGFYVDHYIRFGGATYQACILSLYQDGKYELDTIESSGSWERNGNKFFLTASAGNPGLTKLNLESHAQYKGAKYLILEMIGAAPSDVEYEGWFDMYSSWYQNFYYVKK